MKRILFFNDSMTMGGTEVLLVDLLNSLKQKKCEITLLLPHPSDKDILLKKLSAGIAVKYLSPSAGSHLKKKAEENLMIFFPRLFLLLKKELKQSDYDLIVCFKESFFARIFSIMDLPKILWIHNILYKRKYEETSFKEKISVWLNKKQLKATQHSYNKFDTVVCVSEAAKDAYINILHNGNIPQQDIRVIYNAIDFSKIIELSKSPIENLPQDQTSLALITRNSPEKRIDRLIYASAKLKDEGYNFRVYIIGDIDDEYLRSQIKDNNLQETIIPKGRLDNPFPYILQAKWSLCISERESFSLSLLESMVLNTPVITTDCGGPREIVDDGRYGILVENSSQGVYNGIKMVLDNPSLHMQYSAGLNNAASRFEYGKWLKNIYNLLDI
ncbi:glycosyltransferase [Dysgonomonas sp. 511]|uniref:glycosyltransferase n=1 Tax=Dysgonomonas sp. 511 TaxID=2302930 RepID=UPI0013D3D35C|nr:glycosyltransferase [Dysgonomonas sp. 511]NDV78989.1 glycosyltransferase [Dysgonomonas sp. 511]